MSRFIKHTACSNCGSSDAKGIYEDGSSYCFSCGHYVGSRISPYVLKEEHNVKDIMLPSDVTKEYNKDALEWVGKYGFTVVDLLRCHNPIYYSQQRNQLIFSWTDEYGKTLAWQARNLNKDTPKGKRYFTQGDANNLLPIYSNDIGNSRSVVLVEDCLSAMKCSSHLTGLRYDAMPLLGSGITNRKLSQLRPFYDVLAVFLDPDMFHKAVNISKRAQMLGFTAHVVKAEHDPKELSYQELHKVLDSK